MAIVHLGAKRLQGTKADRVSDSLGSDADGTNTGITLLTNPTTNNGTDTNGATNANRVEVNQLTETIPEGAVITKIKVQYRADESSTNTKLVLYQDNGSGTPTTLLAYTAQFNPNVSDGWYEANIAYDGSGSSASSYTVTSSTAGRLWVGIWANADSSIYKSSGTQKSMSLTYASGATAPTSTFSVTNTYSVDYNFGIVSTLGNPQKLGTGAYSFDQSASGKVELGSASDWQFLHNTGAKWTIATWFKRPTAFNGSSISGDITWLCETTDGVDSGIGIKYDNRNDPDHRFQCEIVNESNSAVCVIQEDNWFPDDDDWHHLAVTFDQTLANTNMIAYLDGVQKGTGNKSATPSDVDSGDTLRIGGGVGTHARYGNWTLDDMGIWKRVLTATEIGKLASNNATKLSLTAENGTSYVRTGAATIYGEQILSGSPLIGQKINNIVMKVSKSSGTNSGNIKVGIWDTSSGATAKHTFWTGAGSDFVQEANPTNEVTFGLNGTTSIGGTHTTTESGVIAINDVIGIQATGSDIDYVYFRKTSATGDGTSKLVEYQGSWSATDRGTMWLICNNGTPSAQLVSSLSNKANLKAYYSMDAISGALSGIAPDDGGNANSYGGVSLDSTNKILGTYSYDFSGSSSGVVGNANQSYGISGTASWTISCWLRFHSVTGSGNEAIFRKQVNNGDSEFEFGANSSNIFAWIEGQTTNIKSSPANNTWYHIVIRRVSGDKDYFYLNGVEVANTSTQNSIDDPSGFRWYLGRRKESNSETFEGNMDEWGIWNRALTTSEITALYNSGDGAKVDSISTTDLVIYWNFEQIPLAQQALPKLSNDFSSTSDLVAMTNLPTNTIFEQIDDTPAYYWKQSDNTWALDYHTFVANAHKSTGDGLYCGGAGGLTNNTSIATNYVWATNSANLPNNLGYSAGGGYKSSFQACGGYIASGSFFDSSTIWDGTAWATAVALDTQRRDTTTYGGSPSSAIIALGRNNSGTEVDSSSKWNGTAWSSAGAVGSQVGEHVAGDGSDTSMMINGGSRGKEADKWNGSSWSATTLLPQDMNSHNQAGKNADTAHIAGGNAYAYDWDGTTWTSVTTVTIGSDTSPRYVSGGGNKDHHWVMTGLDGGTSMNGCELWNGSSWTTKGNMTETQYGGLGDGTIR